MSKGLVRKLLILLVGVLLVLVGILYQIKQNPKSQTVTTNLNQAQDLTAVLTASLQQQRRYFQRCWLRVRPTTTSQNESTSVITWQIFLKIENSGKVKDFQLLNKSLFDAETEKCLKEISFRLKFPSFEGDEISITVPIVISNSSENR